MATKKTTKPYQVQIDVCEARFLPLLQWSNQFAHIQSGRLNAGARVRSKVSLLSQTVRIFANYVKHCTLLTVFMFVKYSYFP